MDFTLDEDLVALQILARAIFADCSRHSKYCLPNFDFSIVSLS